jgi:hypothetical protein
MALPELVPSGKHVDVQATSFSLDALGRFFCNTWEEATGNGGAPFSAVVVGAGMYGAYCATKIFRRHPGKRVLLLDAGPFLVSEHVQNLGRVGLNVPSAVPPGSDSGARELVWGIPWRGNVDFPGLAYCCGGKSLYWGGWCPRLTAGDLKHWPASTAAYLEGNYLGVESETGVVPAGDFIAGELNEILSAAFVTAAASMPEVETGIGDHGVEVAPLAVQGDSPVSGLFGFDKYSSLPMLMDAVREDIDVSGGRDRDRRLFLVPLAHVIKAHTEGNAVSGIEVEVAGRRERLSLSPDCALILATSSVETTRLALNSFPTRLMGRNLMAHVRSDFTVRIRRSALPDVPGHVQTAALLLRGLVPGGRFHIQITGSTSRAGSDELLYRMIPDIDLVDRQLANTDPDWITVTLRCIGEMQGDKTTAIPDPAKSWVNLSPYEFDEFGVPRAYVHIMLDREAAQVWEAMDEAALTVAARVAGSADKIEYLYDDGWQSRPFPLDRPFPDWHRGLGSTYHEAGTLWMGDDPATSVTDPIGRFHQLRNAYACDQSLFPTVGSVNPVITGLTLARQLAERLP